MVNTQDIIISVIMSVYNCAPYISNAIESILNQTFTQWELLICDDGSTDSTYTMAMRYKQQYPDKIRLMRLSCNCKQAVARNKCLDRSRGKYIAIMDGDDTCDPKRLKRQYEFLESHPDVDFIGTGMNFFDENGLWGTSIPELYPRKESFLRNSPFCAPTCMFKKEAVNAVNGYREGRRYWRVEDVDLFVRLYANGFIGANIQKPLYNYREYKETIARRNFKARIHRAFYVIEIVNILKLPRWTSIYGLRILTIGLLPQKAYNVLHRLKYRNPV